MTKVSQPFHKLERVLTQFLSSFVEFGQVASEMKLFKGYSIYGQMTVTLNKGQG